MGDRNGDDDSFTSARAGGNGSFSQVYTDDGAPYYWCSVTGRSMWASPTDWALHHDPETGAPFWSNSITGECAWAEEGDDDTDAGGGEEGVNDGGRLGAVDEGRVWPEAGGWDREGGASGVGGGGTIYPKSNSNNTYDVNSSGGYAGVKPRDEPRQASGAWADADVDADAVASWGSASASASASAHHTQHAHAHVHARAHAHAHTHAHAHAHAQERTHAHTRPAWENSSWDHAAAVRGGYAHNQQPQHQLLREASGASSPWTPPQIHGNHPQTQTQNQHAWGVQTNDSDGWAPHPDAQTTPDTPTAHLPPAFRAAILNKNIAAAAQAAQFAAIEGAGEAAAAKRERKALVAAAAARAAMTPAQAAWSGRGDGGYDSGSPDSGGEAEGSHMSTATYAAHAAKRERRARAERAILEKRRVEKNAQNGVSFGGGEKRRVEFVSFHPEGIDAGAMGVSPGSPETPGEWGSKEGGGRSGSVARGGHHAVRRSKAAVPPSPVEAGGWGGGGDPYRIGGGGGPGAGATPPTPHSPLSESSEDWRPTRKGGKGGGGSGGAAAPFFSRAGTHSGFDIESGAENVAFARRAATNFVGMTLAARSEWLRSMLSGISETVSTQAQFLAIFLTTKSVPFLTSFFAATAGGTVDALRTVRRVVQSARSTMTPTGELPRSLQHAAALCVVAAGGRGGAPLGPGAVAPPRTVRRGEDTSAASPETFCGQPKHFEQDNNTKTTSPHFDDGGGYATAVSAMPSPAGAGAATCTSSLLGGGSSSDAEGVAHVGGGSLSDRLFAPAMVAMLLGREAVFRPDVGGGGIQGFQGSPGRPPRPPPRTSLSPLSARAATAAEAGAGAGAVGPESAAAAALRKVVKGAQVPFDSSVPLESPTQQTLV